MQTTKRYTNQTFTKHVDDEKGRHRTLRGLPEPAVCEVCGDVYADRRWTRPDAERQSLRSIAVKQTGKRQKLKSRRRYKNARRIINGTDQVDKIKAYAETLEKILQAAIVQISTLQLHRWCVEPSKKRLGTYDPQNCHRRNSVLCCLPRR